MPSSRGSSWPRDRTHASCIACSGRQVFTTSVTWEAQTDSRESHNSVSGGLPKPFPIFSWCLTLLGFSGFFLQEPPLEVLTLPPRWLLFVCWFSSVQFSRSVMSHSLQPLESQHTRPPCPSQTPGVYSNSCPLNRDAIQPSHPLSSPSPPAPNPSQHQGLFQWVSSLHQVAKVLEF